jgi:hypothetical protein
MAWNPRILGAEVKGCSFHRNKNPSRFRGELRRSRFISPVSLRLTRGPRSSSDCAHRCTVDSCTVLGLRTDGYRFAVTSASWVSIWSSYHSVQFTAWLLSQRTRRLLEDYLMPTEYLLMPISLVQSCSRARLPRYVSVLPRSRSLLKVLEREGTQTVSLGWKDHICDRLPM